MPSSKPRQRFHDILEEIEFVRRTLDGMTQEAFVEDDVKHRAVTYSMQIMSEAAIKLNELAPELVPGVEWHNLRGLGNKTRHFYDEVNPDILWNIYKRNLDGLEVACRSALEKLKAMERDNDEGRGR